VRGKPRPAEDVVRAAPVYNKLGKNENRDRARCAVSSGDQMMRFIVDNLSQIVGLRQIPCLK
jgi:hypothetical protein